MKKYLMTGIAALTLAGIFTSCSHDMDLYSGGDTTETIKENYENAFISTFGTPAANQTWGFGPSAVAGTRGMTRANEGATYPATHSYQDANGNVIAGANMNHNEWADPSKEFGGWIVPDALTEGQKLRVQKYFQANHNLTYEDPHFRHFFVQQVYTGGTNPPETGNKEATKAADGSVHAGSTLNQLTVGEACSHINDFNAGTCSSSNVLDNGSTVNNGTYHNDQITLMVNVYDTSCFGYHETGGSNVKGVINHNDKMALVSAAVIDAWAASNGNPGEAVVDKWNRSFMGFDYELLPESDIVMDSYAMLSQVPNINNLQYAWDGTNLIPIKQKTADTTAGEQLDLTSTFTNSWNGTMSTNATGGITFVSNGGAIQAGYFGYENVNKWPNFSKFVIEFEEATPVATTVQVGNTYDIPVGTTKYELDITNISASGAQLNVPANNTIKISKIYLESGGQQNNDNALYYETDYLLGEDNKIIFYSPNTNQYGGTIINLSEDDMKTTQDGKTCLNLVKFKQLADDGYHPISTDLKKWVKWQAACDGYYSDWIVTLTEAKRIGDSGEGGGEGGGADVIESIRVIAEDLNAKESKTFEGGSDFDFNDVVFDVIWNKTQNKVSIKVLADGAEYTMYIGGADEKSVDGLMTVNEMFEAANGRTFSKREYPNTAPGSHDDHNNLTYTPYEFDLDSTEWKGETIGQIANSILVRVSKSGVLMTLTAPEAGAAAKVAVGTDYDWCDENQFIDAQDKYNGKFARYVKRELGDDWYKSYVK